ncbi:hypothetical protein [Streptomyces lavendofoliae]|uniref:hypothetical protein n=1 Tax=Streptomyces lavendofoliae TaxID=67314 RepID=UPI003D8F00C1
MTSVARTMKALWSAWWQRWPRWVAWATMLWAVTYASFGLACALSGTRWSAGAVEDVAAALEVLAGALAQLDPECGDPLRRADRRGRRRRAR